MRTLSTNQAQKEVIINENFKALDQPSTFGWRVQNTTGLTFAYWGGNYQSSTGTIVTVNDGTQALTASATNFVYWNPNANTTAVVTGSNSTVIPNGMIPIARCVTSTNSITSVLDLRCFALFPVGVANSMTSSGGNSFMTAAADWEVVGVNGLVVTLKQAQAFMALPMEYTSTFVQTLNGNVNLTLPNNTSGYIIQTSTGVAYVTSISNTSNNLGILYRWVTSSGVITTLIDCSRSNFTRTVGSCFETTLPVTGNLSKETVFATTPWITQNNNGNITVSFRAELYLNCLTAEHGYTVGSLVPVITGTPAMAEICYPAMLRQYGTNGNTFSIRLDAAVKVMSTTGQYVDITPANWQLRLRVYPLR